MIHLFEGDTADSVWRTAFSSLRDVGQVQIGRGGETRELLHTVFGIHDPRQRWTVGRLPAVNPAFAIAEVVWIICGRNDAEFLNYWNRQLPKYAGDSSVYHGAYGFRLRQHLGIDQLERAYLALKHNSMSRQVVLQIWDGRVDFPDEAGQGVNQDIPCNVMSILKIRREQLEWMQINRSNDIFLGVPHNFVQFTTLQEVVAGWLGVPVGTYTHLSDSLHLYIESENNVTVDYNVNAYPNPDILSLDKLESDRVFSVFAGHIEHLISDACTESSIEQISQEPSFNSAYRNLLLIMCAEAARRRGWQGLSQTIITNCTNPLLRQLWVRWIERTNFHQNTG